MSIFESNKLSRFVGSFEGVVSGRKGECNPEKCETLDGKKGAACCKLGYTCPFLQDSNCSIYTARPGNCRIFPRTPHDLKLVKNCGYYWEESEL